MNSVRERVQRVAAKFNGSASTEPQDLQAMPDHEYTSRYLRILDKQKQNVPLQCKPAQLAFLENYTGHDLVLKARQEGLSTIIQAKQFKMLTTRTTTAATLSHLDESTQKLRRMSDRFWRYLPAHIQPRRQYANSVITTYPDLDSESIIATAGNKDTGRGGTYSHVHCSEVAYFKDAEAIVAGILEGGNPEIVLESTPNGAQGYFYNLCMEALDGNSAWHLHFFPWWIEPEYTLPLDIGEELSYDDSELSLLESHPQLTPGQIKWRRSKQRRLKHLFIQEYPEDPVSCFLRSGFGYFGDLSPYYKAPTGATYDQAHRYVAGLDFGQANDFTVLSIGDANTLCQVELLRINQLPWAEMRSRVIQACNRWHVSTLWAEKNSMGENLEALQSELIAAQAKVKLEHTTSLMPFITSNASKASIMGALHVGLHESHLQLLPIPEQKNEMSAFRATQLPSGAWQLAAPSGEHDDIVIANALMFHGIVNNRWHGGIHFID